MYNRGPSTMKCLASKQRKLKPKAERPKCPLDCLEEERKERYERLKKCAPPGFHLVLEKIIRAVALSRPIHICLFIADLLDAQISRRTFDDVSYGCQLKKSQKRVPYPTESCMLIKNFMMCESMKGRAAAEHAQFLRGVIPQYEIAEPALDRYRDYAGIGDFEMPLEEEKVEEEKEKVHKVEEDETAKHAFPEDLCIPERDFTGPPAVDRYRDYAGIGPFEPQDVEDECFDHMLLLSPVPNCKCTFCTRKAEKKKECTIDDGVPKEPKPDPCAPQPVLETLYIEQAVYREPAYETEQLFKEKDIKACEPFGEIFQQDEHYEDEGLQPPDPFSEHPADRDCMTESPQESYPDSPLHAEYTAEQCEADTPDLDYLPGLKTAPGRTSQQVKTPKKTPQQALKGRCSADVRAQEITAAAEKAEKTDELETSQSKVTQATAGNESLSPQTEGNAPDKTASAQQVSEAGAEGETTEVESAAAEAENVEGSQRAAEEEQPPEDGTEAEAETAAEETNEEETKEEAEEEEETKPEDAAVEPAGEEEQAEENAEPTEA